MANGRMGISGLFCSGLVNEKSRVSALAQKSVRTIVKSHSGSRWREAYKDACKLVNQGFCQQVLQKTHDRFNLVEFFYHATQPTNLALTGH